MALLIAAQAALARPTPTRQSAIASDKTRAPAKSNAVRALDDSTLTTPTRDLLLNPAGEHAADALAHFVTGLQWEEQGELDKALEEFRQVLNLDPGQITLAVRVAALLAHDDQYPEAIDVLKDAVKAKPKAPEPYRELAFIYARYLRKMDEAVQFANKAIALAPHQIDGYERLFEVEYGANDEKQALAVLERAAKITTDDPQFWLRLGRLYLTVYVKPDASIPSAAVPQVNDIFRHAATNGKDNAATLREVADYYAATQQISDALPLYVRTLELDPDDAKVREKLATAFVLTNQRAKAIATLEQIVQEHPEKYQPYELLAQLHDNAARALARDKKENEAVAEFQKAAQNYEQSILTNPNRPATYLRLAELLLAPLKKEDRAITLLQEARHRFPGTPEFAYYLGLALREAKRPKEAVVVFEEALQEAKNAESDYLKPRFYLDYGAASEQAGLYDKAAELFRQAIAMDPANAAEPYNYLGYMWAEQNSHLDEAEDAVRRALQLDPDNGAYLDSLGWVQYRQGKHAEAIETLQRAIKNLPREDAVLFEHLGDALAKLRRFPEALEAWQKAKVLDPSNAELAAKIEEQNPRMTRKP